MSEVASAPGSGSLRTCSHPFRAGFSEFLVPSFLGSVLLVAAILKAFQLVTEPASMDGWFQAFVIDVETLVALGLLLHLKPRWTRRASLVLFSCFLAVSFHHLLAGARSCGCLGTINVKPWLALSFDVVAIIALWLWRPLEPYKENSLAQIAVISICCLTAFPLLAWAAAAPKFPQLTVSTPTEDWHKVGQGQQRILSLGLRNPHNRPVVIDHFDTSCPCLQAHRVPFVIEPGKEATIDFALDLAEEPAFTGLLTIAILGRTPSDDIALRAELSVQVAAFAE